MKKNKHQLLKMDSRRRITINILNPGDVVQIIPLEDGKFLLTPVELVPKHIIENGRLEDGTKCKMFIEVKK